MSAWVRHAVNVSNPSILWTTRLEELLGLGEVERCPLHNPGLGPDAAPERTASHRYIICFRIFLCSGYRKFLVPLFCSAFFLGYLPVPFTFRAGHARYDIMLHVVCVKSCHTWEGEGEGGCNQFFMQERRLLCFLSICFLLAGAVANPSFEERSVRFRASVVCVHYSSSVFIVTTKGSVLLRFSGDVETILLGWFSVLFPIRFWGQVLKRVGILTSRAQSWLPAITEAHYNQVIRIKSHDRHYATFLAMNIQKAPKAHQPKPTQRPADTTNT